MDSVSWPGLYIQNRASAIVDQVEFSGGILPESADDPVMGEQQRPLPDAGTDFLQSPEATAGKIAEDIVPYQAWNECAPVDEAPDDRDPPVRIVGILGDWQSQSCRVAGSARRVAVAAFHDVPSEVPSADDQVHFLKTAWADISGKEAPRATVE